MRWARWWRSVRERRAATTVHHMPPLRPLSRSGRVPTLRAAHLAEPRCFSERYVRCGVRGRTREGSMMGCIPLPMSGKARNADWQTAGQSGLLYPCAAAMETDPTKLGTMKLMGSCCRTRRKDGGAGVTHKRKISIVTDRPPVGSRAPPRHSQPAETATHRHSVCPKLCAQPSLTEWCDRQRPAGLL